MLCIINNSTNPYYNIASEEYILKNFSEDCFMLYRDEPSIIVGKHQNALAEINYQYVKEKGIKVVRRLSGGGTVYHDEGNLNFCFIKKGEEGKLVDFKKFTQPIIDILQKLNIPAEYGKRNELIINGKKFSGNAEHIFKRRTLHHGTILYSSNLENLRLSLKIAENSYTDKAVKSVRSSVTNISGLMKNPLSIEKFIDLVNNHIIKTESSQTYIFNKGDNDQINTLVKNKYATWDWSFGYSPDYSLKKTIKTGNLTFNVDLSVKKGLIQHCIIESKGSFGKTLQNILINKLHNEEVIRQEIEENAAKFPFSAKSFAALLF